MSEFKGKGVLGSESLTVRGSRVSVFKGQGILGLGCLKVRLLKGESV